MGMGNETFKNLESFEGTLSGAETKTFRANSRRIIYTNDSGAVHTLTFGGDSITAKSGETLQLEFWTDKLTTDGTGPYRLWVFG